MRAMAAATKSLGMGHQVHPRPDYQKADAPYCRRVGVPYAVAPDVERIAEAVASVMTVDPDYPLDGYLPDAVPRSLLPRLRRHADALLALDLGDEDEELQVLRTAAARSAAFLTRLLADDPRLWKYGHQTLTWTYLRELAVVTEGLLRRWCQRDTDGGRYQLRAEKDVHGGYYVWDTRRGARVARRRHDDGREPVHHVTLPFAWTLTRRLNEAAR